MNLDAIDAAGFGRRLLDVIVAKADTFGLDLPTRRYLHAGETAWDGEEFTVALVQVYPGRPGSFTPGGLDLGTTFVAEYRVSVVVCVPGPAPSGKAPSGDRLDAAGVNVATLAATLLRVVAAARMDETLAPWRDTVQVGPVIIDGPAGGLVACSLTVAAQI